MTFKVDTSVQAKTPVVLTRDDGSSHNKASESPAEKVEKAKRYEERVANWKAISQAGGIDTWVQAQLVAKGLSTHGLDPSRMSASERNAYKEKKKAEADEKRALKKRAWEAYQAVHISFLGQGIYWSDKAKKDNKDKFDIEQRDARLKANGLPAIEDAQELAKQMGLTVPQLRWLAFHRDVDNGVHYRRWTIPKRDGSQRTITAPKRTLKAAQRWALRKFFERLPVHKSVHGFMADRSIASNAKVHAGADVIIKIDIKDFFPTLSWKRVRGLLRKAGVADGVATLLSLIATESPREAMQFRGKTMYVATGPRVLPQGAPTSPAITNAICLRLDQRMSGLAQRFAFAYTRYADDLTFSWRKPETKNDNEFPQPCVGALLRGAKAILTAEGFAIHPAKTRIMRAGSRQTVTGLVVNQPGGASAKNAVTVRPTRDMRRQLKAAVHNREHGKPGKEGESLSHLKGLAAFLMMTHEAEGKALMKRIQVLEEQGKS